LADFEELAVSALINVIHTIFTLYSLAIILNSFIGMMVDPYHPVARFLKRITEPVLAPIRRVVPPIQAGGGYLDLSPMVVLLLLWVLERILIAILLGVAR
jgi:YggT family protein